MTKAKKSQIWGWTLCLLVLGSCGAEPPRSPQTDSTPAINPSPPTTPAVENLGQQLPITARAIINGTPIALEVAENPEQQQMGLMYRTYLAGDRGMLFPFKPAQITRFWMKNTKIPLDMLFLHRGKVVAIESNVPPCTQDPCPVYGPDRLWVDQVIELRAGRAAELQINVGDGIAVEFLTPPTSPKP